MDAGETGMELGPVGIFHRDRNCVLLLTPPSLLLSLSSLFSSEAPPLGRCHANVPNVPRPPGHNNNSRSLINCRLFFCRCFLSQGFVFGPAASACFLSLSALLHLLLSVPPSVCSVHFGASLTSGRRHRRLLTRPNKRTSCLPLSDSKTNPNSAKVA